jgi:hypothetical protein
MQFMRALIERGLKGVQLFVSDKVFGFGRTWPNSIPK